MKMKSSENIADNVRKLESAKSSTTVLSEILQYADYALFMNMSEMQRKKFRSALKQYILNDRAIAQKERQVRTKLRPIIKVETLEKRKEEDKSRIDSQLQRNLELLKRLQQSYDAEQQKRQNINDTLSIIDKINLDHLFNNRIYSSTILNFLIDESRLNKQISLGKFFFFE